MQEQDTYLKLYRAIISSSKFSNPIELKIWIWLLCKASWKDRNIPIKIGKNFINVSLKRGQLLFGRNKAEEFLHIDGSTIYKILQKFVLDKDISIKSNNQFSIITVIKYNDYQDANNDDLMEFEEFVTAEKQQDNSKITAEEQRCNNNVTQIRTVNKDKEIKPKGFIPNEKQIESFNKFIDWIKIDVPEIAKMKKPFTINEYVTLIGEMPDNKSQTGFKPGISKKQVIANLQSIENNIGYLKKYRSPYLCILAWNKENR